MLRLVLFLSCLAFGLAFRITETVATPVTESTPTVTETVATPVTETTPTVTEMVASPVTESTPTVSVSSNRNKTWLYQQTIPEESHLSDLLSTNRFGGGSLFTVTDGRYYVLQFKFNFYKALELCYQLDKRLATFDNEDEYLQLVSLLGDQDMYGTTKEPSYWVAGSDLGERDTYVWMSTGNRLKYAPWKNGEPKHTYKADAKEIEYCIELYSEYQYKLNDNACSNKNFVVCENNS